MTSNPSELKAGLGLTIANAKAIAYHLETGKDNGEITREALALYLRGIADDLSALNEQIKEQAELIEKFYKALKDVMSSNKPHSEKARKAFAAYTQWKETKG